MTRPKSQSARGLTPLAFRPTKSRSMLQEKAINAPNSLPPSRSNRRLSGRDHVAVDVLRCAPPEEGGGVAHRDELITEDYLEAREKRSSKGMCSLHVEPAPCVRLSPKNLRPKNPLRAPDPVREDEFCTPVSSLTRCHKLLRRCFAGRIA